MKIFFLAGLSLLAAACANPSETKSVASYQCGAELVRVKYQNDGFIVLTHGEHRLILHKVKGFSGTRYEDITGHIVFQNRGAEGYLEVNNDIYPPCRPIVSGKL